MAERRNAFMGHLSQNGEGLAAMEYGSKLAQQEQMLKIQQQVAEIAKTQGEAGKLLLGNLKEKLRVSGQYFMAVKNAPPEMRGQIAMQAAQKAIQDGMITEQELPPGILQGQYTPEADAWVNSKLGQTLEFDQFIDNQLQEQKFAEEKSNNAAQLAVTKRGQDISAATARRGQDMTNARMSEQNQIARDQRQAQQDLQNQDALASFDETITAAEELKNHPGLNTAVGVKGFTGVMPTWLTPGTNATNFKAKLETFQSKLFLPMVSKLKGMGQLSDAEGKKLTAAAGALNRDMSEVEFKAEVDKIITSLTAARNRKAGATQQGGGEIQILRDASGNIVGVK
jgi:hypothetical protein